MVLGKRVGLYHNLVIGLKTQLEQEAAVNELEEQELADLEGSLASGSGRAGALETMSLMSDATPGAQVVWAGGACDGLVYESVDELRVAVESLQVQSEKKRVRFDKMWLPRHICVVFQVFVEGWVGCLSGAAPGIREFCRGQE